MASRRPFSIVNTILNFHRSHSTRYPSFERYDNVSSELWKGTWSTTTPVVTLRLPRLKTSLERQQHSSRRLHLNVMRARSHASTCYTQIMPSHLSVALHRLQMDPDDAIQFTSLTRQNVYLLAQPLRLFFFFALNSIYFGWVFACVLSRSVSCSPA